MNELLKKFLSRKFLIAVANFAMAIGAIVLGEGDPNLVLAGMVWAAVSGAVYVIVEGINDGKSISAEYKYYLNPAADALIDLVDVYEEKFGATATTDLIQEITASVQEKFLK